jgi:hypothetical protein
MFERHSLKIGRVMYSAINRSEIQRRTLCKRFKMFLELNYLLSVNIELEINWFQILAWK